MIVALELYDSYRYRVFNMLVCVQTSKSFLGVYENPGLERPHALKVISRVITLWVLLSSFFWSSSYDSDKLIAKSFGIASVLILIDRILPIDSPSHPFHVKTLSVRFFFSFSPGETFQHYKFMSMSQVPLLLEKVQPVLPCSWTFIWSSTYSRENVLQILW